jgi:hypothetical protein
MKFRVAVCIVQNKNSRNDEYQNDGNVLPNIHKIRKVLLVRFFQRHNTKIRSFWAFISLFQL